MAKTKAGGLFRVWGKLVDSSGKEVSTSKAKTAAPAPNTPNTGDLAEDFPRRKELAEAGLTTKAQVAEKSDAELVELKGIGKASVKEIRDALK